MARTIVRRIAGVIGTCLVMYGIAPTPAFAVCLRENCWIVSVQVEQCEEVSYSNDEQLEYLRRSSDSERIAKMRSSLSGVKISGEIVTARAVPCAANDELIAGMPPKFEPGTRRTLFLEAADGSCEDLEGETLEKFVPALCCDTIPQTGICLAPDTVLLPVPSPSAKSDW